MLFKKGLEASNGGNYFATSSYTSQYGTLSMEQIKENDGLEKEA